MGFEEARLSGGNWRQRAALMSGGECLGGGGRTCGSSARCADSRLENSFLKERVNTLQQQLDGAAYDVATPCS